MFKDGQEYFQFTNILSESQKQLLFNYLSTEVRNDVLLFKSIREDYRIFTKK